MENRTSKHDAREGFDRDSSKQRLYNPYKDLQLPYRNFQLSTSPEFLFAEEASRQRRSWSENLTFYTGCGYLAGAVGGASVGLVSGVKSFESGDTTKLRINRILNSSGHSGRVWGNRLGVIGLLYAGIESGVVAVRDTDDVWNSVAAGLGTGALYRAARGVRSAAVAGAVGGVLVGMAVTTKHALKRNSSESPEMGWSFIKLKEHEIIALVYLQQVSANFKAGQVYDLIETICWQLQNKEESCQDFALNRWNGLSFHQRPSSSEQHHKSSGNIAARFEVEI